MHTRINYNQRFVFVGMTIATFALLVPSFANADVMLGQMDTFQDGTTNNWMNSAGTYSLQDGGAGGSGDFYLQVVGYGGSGSGSRVAVHNSAQWTGNYTAAGVTGVELDMANFGGTDLTMRFLLFSSAGLFTSLVPADVPADGVWRTYMLGLLPGDLNQVGGGGTVQDALMDVQQLLIRHDTDGTQGIPGGTPVVGTLGIDNIRAIPEPASMLLLGMSGLGFMRRRS